MNVPLYMHATTSTWDLSFELLSETVSTLYSGTQSWKLRRQMMQVPGHQGF